MNEICIFLIHEHMKHRCLQLQRREVAVIAAASKPVIDVATARQRAAKRDTQRAFRAVPQVVITVSRGASRAADEWAGARDTLCSNRGPGHPSIGAPCVAGTSKGHNLYSMPQIPHSFDTFASHQPFFKENSSPNTYKQQACMQIANTRSIGAWHSLRSKSPCSCSDALNLQSLSIC